jgi:predicted transcriptional regulator
MANKKTIELKSVENSIERDILLFLNKKGDTIYGDIIKELKLSTVRGQETIYSLINRGFISHKEKTSKLKLNIEIKE